jgi:peptide deformylase
MNESEVLIIDTNPYASETPVTVKIFSLVPETHTALKKILPEFDFQNPPVNPNAFSSSLVETCRKYNGLGLSANQCGYEHRVFVMGAGENYVAFFNPKIVSSYGSIKMDEGCLSFPNLFLSVERAETVVVEYQDYNGNKKSATFSGLTARCFQHELDHLNGIVYTHKVKPVSLMMAMKKRKKDTHSKKK